MNQIEQTYESRLSELNGLVRSRPLLGREVREIRPAYGKTETRTGTVYAHWVSHGTTCFGWAQATMPEEKIQFGPGLCCSVEDVEILA